MNAPVERARDGRFGVATVEVAVRGDVAAAACAAAEDAELLSVTIAIAAREGAGLALFERSARDGDRFYWEQPLAHRAIAACGRVAACEAEGAGRFGASAGALRATFDDAVLVACGDAWPRTAGPIATGGFAFEDESATASDVWPGFAPVSLVVPALVWVRDGERAAVTASGRRGEGESPDAFAARVADAALRAADRFADAACDGALRREPATATHYTARPDRAHEVYLGAVADATQTIGRGDLEKVVLARSLEVETDEPFVPASVLASLRRVHAASTIFAVERDDAVFLGASPECLVRIVGDEVETAAVAGSAPRGRSPEADERFGRALRESKKEQEEHAVVVREIEAVLREVCDDVDHPEAPALLALDGIQHLQTPFRARLRPDGRDGGDEGGRPHLIELAGRLHPTPAVGGTPREAAREWIRDREALERGWYAGGVGFVGANGDGELHVGLRSGLLEGAHARLFAGAGIVGASEPADELAETRLKLRTLLSQLTEI